jgi:hypothetical protein
MIVRIHKSIPAKKYPASAKVIGEAGDYYLVETGLVRRPAAGVQLDSAMKLSGGPVRDPAAAEPPAGGPGSELKVLLKNWLGITANPNCSCNAKARQMDEWGCEVCEQRIEQIVDWLGDEARRRKLPFMRMAATQLVKLAIRRARKAASRAADGGHKSIEGTDFDE